MSDESDNGRQPSRSAPNVAVLQRRLAFCWEEVARLSQQVRALREGDSESAGASESLVQMRRKELDALRQTLDEKDVVLENMEERLRRLKGDLAERDTTLDLLKAQLERQDAVLDELHERLQDRDLAADEFEQKITKRENALRDLRRQIKDRDRQISDANKREARLKQVRDTLKERLQESDRARIEVVNQKLRERSKGKSGSLPGRGGGYSLLAFAAAGAVVAGVLCSGVLQKPEGTTAPEPTSAETISPLPALAPVPVREIRRHRDRLRDGSPGPLLVEMPEGTFVMGGRSTLPTDDDSPARTVHILPFYIGAHELTVGEYDRFARATGRPSPQASDPRQPVVEVSWNDALAYVNWLSAQTGQRYRLPSEAEWEYAARAGSTGSYWWGFESHRGLAVCFDCGTPWDNVGPAPIGSLEPNPFGLYNISGNVMEWVADCYHPNYVGAPHEGSAWIDGPCEERVVRGGAFSLPKRSMRSAARKRFPLDTRTPLLGVRVARDI